MTIFLNMILFLLGMCICVQLMAAFYGIVDLWYAIRTAYPIVIRRILAWSLTTAVLAWLLGEGLRPAFLWGLAGYIVFHVFSFWGYRLLFLRNLRLLGIRRPFGKEPF